jgi:hypothetical protein
MQKVFVIFISDFLLASCVLPNRYAEFEAAYKKGIAKVSGVGFGFTLIRRAVLEQVGAL